MPLYVYEVVLPDGTGGEQFEILQAMSADPFTTHPDTGEPVRRVFGNPNAPRAWTDSQGAAQRLIPVTSFISNRVDCPCGTRT